MSLDDILEYCGEAYRSELFKVDESEEIKRLKKEIESHKNYIESLKKEKQRLTDENNQLRALSKELIKVKSGEKSEGDKSAIEELDKKRKELYNEVTSLKKKETAYSKSIGKIFGALEELRNEID